MTELLLTFPAEFRNEMNVYLEKQRADIEKASRGMTGRLMRSGFKRAVNMDFLMVYDYKFRSETQAVLTFKSNMPLLSNRKIKGPVGKFLCREVQKRFTNIVKVEVLSDG